ncbi:MAG: flagellar hook-associated protein FlgK [Actinomycetia bacterium]|nr:flagellar hook-associated protein FlgK [Actinomycetes bacterium]
MSDFGGISIAYSGLNAQRKRMDVISENIANVNTPGYHRQRVEFTPVDNLASGMYSGRVGRGGGVRASDVTRLREHVLSSHARIQGGVAAERSSTAGVLEELESIIGGLDSGGIHDQMNAMFNSFDDLASAPDDTALRQVVLQRAEAVADGFSRTATTIDQLRERTVSEAGDAVTSMNELAGQIAVLDSEILGAINVDAKPNALLDRRDTLVDELATYADITVIENSNGQVTISLDGQLLVSNGASSGLTLDSQADPGLGVLGYEKVSVINDNGRELNVKSGSLAAILVAVNISVPDAKQDLDTVSYSLVDDVNTVHQAGAGLDGSSGLNFFEAGPGRGQLYLSPDVIGQTDKIAAAATGVGRLDNSNARTMALLAEAPTGPVGQFAELVGSLAARVSTAKGSAVVAEAASDQATNLAISAGGVSLDEELTDLITAQRSYEAAARVMTAIDKTLQTLVTSTGLVGR